MSLPAFGDTSEEVVRSIRVHALKSTLRSVVPISELQSHPSRVVDAGQKTPTPMSVFNDRDCRFSVIAHMPRVPASQSAIWATVAQIADADRGSRSH